MLLSNKYISNQQIGGATALIGDPSFKLKERDVLSLEDVQRNVVEIRKDVERVMECSGDENLLFVNNYDWYKDMNVLEFLRDIGKQVFEDFSDLQKYEDAEYVG